MTSSHLATFTEYQLLILVFRLVRIYDNFQQAISSQFLNSQAPYGYPTYHSLYDNYYLASEIIDKGFVHHQAVARMLAVTATELADAIVLPYDLKAYATYLSKALADLELKYETLLEQNNATFSTIYI